MANEREVNVAMISYQGAKNQTLYGFRGESIEVHDDDLDRFDELNGYSTEAPNGDDHPEPFLDIDSSGKGPGPLDKGNEGEPKLEQPAGRATLAEWQAYAEQEGVELEHENGSAKTKRELHDELTGD